MDDAKQRFSLKRWSQRKHAARREPVAPSGGAVPLPAAVPPATAPGTAPTTTTPHPPAAAAPLPPVETLTFEADFSAFMKPDVDPSLKNAALKKLFADPRFNVMDGLDVYIDDYSKPDPIDAATVARLVQSRYLFDPPKTRVTERGEVEDVPVDDATGPVIAADAPADAAALATPESTTPASPQPTTLASPEPAALVPADPDAPASSAPARSADRRETDR